MTNFMRTADRAARLAGDILLKHYNKLKHTDIHKKGKHDLVTKADLDANQIIIKTIKRKFPEHDFLSEETGFENNPDQFTWVIDPLDGTTNYTIGDPLFCTALALLYHEEIILSIIFAPLLKEFFVAERGHGARLNGLKIHVSATRKLADSIVVVGRSHLRSSHSASEKIQKRLERSALNTRRLGSNSMDLAYVACGRVDGCLLIPPKINLWDCVAGILLVREAGGKVTDFRGRDWRLHSDGVIATNRLVHQQLGKLAK